MLKRDRIVFIFLSLTIVNIGISYSTESLSSPEKTHQLIAKGFQDKNWSSVFNTFTLAEKEHVKQTILRVAGMSVGIENNQEMEKFLVSHGIFMHDVMAVSSSDTEKTQIRIKECIDKIDAEKFFSDFMSIYSSHSPPAAEKVKFRAHRRSEDSVDGTTDICLSRENNPCVGTPISFQRINGNWLVNQWDGYGQ